MQGRKAHINIYVRDVIITQIRDELHRVSGDVCQRFLDSYFGHFMSFQPGYSCNSVLIHLSLARSMYLVPARMRCGFGLEISQSDSPCVSRLWLPGSISEIYSLTSERHMFHLLMEYMLNDSIARLYRWIDYQSYFAGESSKTHQMMY